MSSGFYRLYGVVGDLQIRASRDGYVTQTRQVNVPPFATPRTRPDTEFRSHASEPGSGSCRDLQGHSQSIQHVRYEVSSRCRCERIYCHSDSRRLTADYRAERRRVRDNFTGRHSNRFEGRARPDSVELALGAADYYYYYYYSWGFVERLTPSPNRRLGVFSKYLSYSDWDGGRTRNTVNHLSGSERNPGPHMTHLADSAGRRTRLSSCNARDHQLVLTRQ